MREGSNLTSAVLLCVDMATVDLQLPLARTLPYLGDVIFAHDPRLADQRQTQTCQTLGSWNAEYPNWRPNQNWESRLLQGLPVWIPNHFNHLTPEERNAAWLKWTQVPGVLFDVKRVWLLHVRQTYKEQNAVYGEIWNLKCLSGLLYWVDLIMWNTSMSGKCLA